MNGGNEGEFSTMELGEMRRVRAVFKTKGNLGILSWLLLYSRLNFEMSQTLCILDNYPKPVDYSSEMREVPSNNPF